MLDRGILEKKVLLKVLPTIRVTQFEALVLGCVKTKI